MKKSNSLIEKIGFKTGFIIFLALVSYFLLMKFLGLSQILELRYFNFAILTVGICYGINKLKHELNEPDFYLKGWAQGLYISGVSILSFALFMAVYISYFDEPLMQHIRETTTLGYTLTNGFNIFLALFMENMAGAIVIILGAMQYFKSQGTVRSDTAVPMKK